MSLGHLPGPLSAGPISHHQPILVGDIADEIINGGGGCVVGLECRLFVAFAGHVCAQPAGMVEAESIAIRTERVEDDPYAHVEGRLRHTVAEPGVALGLRDAAGLRRDEAKTLRNLTPALY